MDGRSAAQLLWEFGNETRMRVFSKLLKHSEGMFVSEIADALDMPMSTLSLHLKALKNVGALRSTRHGNQIRYTAEPRFVAGQLRALAREIEHAAGAAHSKTATLKKPAPTATLARRKRPPRSRRSSAG